MNAEKNAAAYAAIDKYVHSYLFNRGLLGLEEDVRTKCHDFFATYVPWYEKYGRVSIETFACRAANACIKNAARKSPISASVLLKAKGTTKSAPWLLSEKPSASSLRNRLKSCVASRMAKKNFLPSQTKSASPTARLSGAH
jgi:hypothetical protein